MAAGADHQRCVPVAEAEACCARHHSAWAAEAALALDVLARATQRTRQAAGEAEALLRQPRRAEAVEPAEVLPGAYLARAEVVPPSRALAAEWAAPRACWSSLALDRRMAALPGVAEWKATLQRCRSRAGARTASSRR